MIKIKIAKFDHFKHNKSVIHSYLIILKELQFLIKLKFT